MFWAVSSDFGLKVSKKCQYRQKFAHSKKVKKINFSVTFSLKTFFSWFFLQLSMDSNSASNYAFFIPKLHFWRKKLSGHIRTFYELWRQTRTKNYRVILELFTNFDGKRGRNGGKNGNFFYKCVLYTDIQYTVFFSKELKKAYTFQNGYFPADVPDGCRHGLFSRNNCRLHCLHGRRLRLCSLHIGRGRILRASRAPGGQITWPRSFSTIHVQVYMRTSCKLIGPFN